MDYAPFCSQTRMSADFNYMSQLRPQSMLDTRTLVSRILIYRSPHNWKNGVLEVRNLPFSKYVAERVAGKKNK